eukprot:1982371-Prymnesium_polylepis.2
MGRGALPGAERNVAAARVLEHQAACRGCGGERVSSDWRAPSRVACSGAWRQAVRAGLKPTEALLAQVLQVLVAAMPAAEFNRALAFRRVRDAP